MLGSQFSTALLMGRAALAVAQITLRDLVLALSTGAGLLAILAKMPGATFWFRHVLKCRTLPRSARGNAAYLLDCAGGAGVVYNIAMV